jgi:hypothetical protein
VIDFAENRCQGYPEISFQTINIFSNEYERVECDVLIATLFLHHFKDEQLVQLLRTFQTQARSGIVINDLHRHWLAYRSINVLTAIFSKSPMVKYDAGISVLRGFRSSEIHAIMRFGRISNYTLRWMWAFRWQVIIRTQK